MLKVGGGYTDHSNAKLQWSVWTINMVIVDNNKHAKVPFTTNVRISMAGFKTVISVYL